MRNLSFTNVMILDIAYVVSIVVYLFVAILISIVLCVIGSYFEAVYSAYSQEASLRENITTDILKQTDRDTLTVYLSCWLHEPYVGYEAKEKLEALLTESGLR